MDNVLLSRIRQEAYEAGYNDGLTEGYNLAAKKIVPTIDVPDRKVGEWKDYPIADGALQCSVCGTIRLGDASHYCPNCGARMRGESDG